MSPPALLVCGAFHRRLLEVSRKEYDGLEKAACIQVQTQTRAGSIPYKDDESPPLAVMSKKKLDDEREDDA